MTNPQQLPLFSPEPEPENPAPPDENDGALDPTTPLEEALELYEGALHSNGASIYTVKAFKSDINVLGSWGGHHRAIGDVGTNDLNQLLHWMMHERGIPCIPKTYARRVTALKNFFGWLHSQGGIKHDPSNAVIQKTPSTPLPD